MSKVITIDPANPSPVGLAQAAEALASGALVLCPTETLYGIAADVDNPAAIERLAGLKGRGDDKPFGLIIPHLSALDQLVREVPPSAQALMERHWPGPLTLVLLARPGLHPRLVSDPGKVGLRLSPHPVAGALARALGRAITATSANPAGAPAPARVEDIDPAIAAGVDIILDAGPCAGGPASTVVDCTSDPPEVLRPGAVKLASDPADPAPAKN